MGQRRRVGLKTAGGVGLALVFSAQVGTAGGFSVFDQSAQTMGIAAAATALSERPSALFYNPGGAAFLTKKAFEGSLQYPAQVDVSFAGVPPNGSVASFFDQEAGTSMRFSGYWIQPIKKTINFGLAVFSPFGFTNEWGEPDTYAGRFVSLRSELETLDFNPNLTFRFGDKLGIGVGAIVRVAQLTHGRRIPTIDPRTRNTVDIADLAIDSGQETGYGWNAGLLYRLSEGFSWGFSYRSRMTIDFAGSGRLTQILTGNQQLDDVVRISNPFDQDLPLTTGLKFPDVLSTGLAIGKSDGFQTTLDVNWTGWSQFDEVDVTFTTFPVFGDTFRQNFDDSFTYRVGFQLTTGKGSAYRIGVALDESPQPLARVGPFLVDADRTIVSAGWGKDWLDFAVVYQDADERVVTGNADGINGTYAFNSLTVGLTVKKK